MALTAQVKDELARVKITRTSARKAEVSSIFRFSSALHLVNGSIVLEAELDTAQAAKRLRSEIKDLYGQFADIVVINAAGLRRSNRYLLRVTRDGAPWPGRPVSSTTGAVPFADCPRRSSTAPSPTPRRPGAVRSSPTARSPNPDAPPPSRSRARDPRPPSPSSAQPGASG